jgi:sensor c-di-GMP phosphodiesterase-like protein
MKRILKQRVLISLIATLVAATLGALAGYCVGREIALRLTARALSRDAARSIAHSVAFSRDAHAVLDAMNASRAPFCSDADLESILGLVYRSHFLKEAGRVRDGKIACSTTFGRMNLPNSEQPKPDFIGADGVKVFQNPPLFRLEHATVTSLQAGDSYVVLNPYINSLAERSAVHLESTIIDASLKSSPHAVVKGSQIPAADSDFRLGDTLYSTRCSLAYNTCMTASLSVAEALEAERLQFRGFILFGALCGAWLGLFAFLAYRRSRDMERQLRRAIRRDKLRVVYQPIVKLPSRRIVGAEALARWTDEEGCEVGPDIFVKLAEERGFVEEITRLVVRHALRDFADTLRSRPDFRLSINVAAADLADPGFLPMLEESLNQAGVPAQSLAIEITERCTANRQVAKEAIHGLRRKGYCVQIDDFGTGYSSLSYLHELAVDFIKIDRSFTEAIGTEAVTVSILPQILAMAETLNLEVIAEGIETELQADYFSATQRPLLAQGWFFGRPVPPTEFLRAFDECERNELVAAGEL